VVRVAINVHSKLQILSTSALYFTTPPLQLQPDNGSSCNWYTLWVANTEHFRLNYTTPSVATQQWYELQLIYPPSCKYWVSGFHLGSGDTSCNWSMTQVVIEVLTVLQLSACWFAIKCFWRVAIEVLVELQSLSFLFCWVGSKSFFLVTTEVLLFTSCNRYSSITVANH
jgi:hypothetical protein